MPANLTDNYVANTYKGVLHANGEELPAEAKVQVYDGAGNATALKLGVLGADCMSLSAYGLTANDFKYPDTPGDQYSIVCQTSNNLTGINNLELLGVQEIFCNASVGDSYSRSGENIVPIPLVECGIVKDVNEVAVSAITKADGGADIDQTGEFSITKVAAKGGIITTLTLSQISRPINPNLLINAQGIINQRQIAANTALNQEWNPQNYFIDRWKSNSGVVINWNLTSNINRNAITMVAPAGGISQIIEKINIVPGSHVLSWTGTAAASIFENDVLKATGSGGTGSIKTLSVNLGGGGDVRITFANGTVSLPKFERGSIRTEFDYRSFGSELQLCQRYFSKTYPYAVRPQTANRDGSIMHHGIEPINPTAHNMQWRYPVEVTSNVIVYSFNPLTAENPNRFAVLGQLDSDRLTDIRSHTCTVSYGTSSVLAIQRTSGADNLYPNGVRVSTAHFVVDAEL